MPSYVTVNNSQDEQSVQVFNVCIKCLKFKHKTSTDKCKQDHSWLFSAKHIKTITLYKRDERCIFFYVQSDDFQMYFPSEAWRQRFYEMVSWIYGVLYIYIPIWGQKVQKFREGGGHCVLKWGFIRIFPYILIPRKWPRITLFQHTVVVVVVVGFGGDNYG